MLVARDIIHKMLVRVANREDPDQTSLIWVCTVCLGLFGRQLKFKILEHLPYEPAHEILILIAYAQKPPLNIPC